MFSRHIPAFIIFSYYVLINLAHAQAPLSEKNQAEAADILFSIAKADESTQPASGTLFTASAQFGFLYLTGDTRSADIKSGVDLRFERDLWRSFFLFNLLVKKTDSQNDGDSRLKTSDHKWGFETQTNYTLNPINRNYVYGNIFYEESRFSSFDSQASVSTGWGRRWFENRDFSLDADIGPGFKRDVPQVSLEEIDAGASTKTQDTLILQAQAIYLRKISEHIEFKQLLLVKHAIEKGQNSIYKAESSVTSRLIESLQIKLNLVIDYNTKVDTDKNNLNTETSVVLVYSF